MIIDSQSKLPVTGLIIAQDEEKYIHKAIMNLRPNVKEVIVIDGGSKDRTVEIAKNLKCRVEHRKFDFDFSAQRNFGIECVTTEWVLWLDADEYFDEHVYDVIPTLCMKSDKNVSAYQFYRRSIFDGRRVDNDEDFQWRLTRKGGCVWDGKIHEGLRHLDGFIGKRLPKEFILFHEHSMARQLYNNKLYWGINNGVTRRPGDLEGSEYRDTEGKWVDVPTDRNA